MLLEIIRNYKRNRNYMLIFMFFQLVLDLLSNTWNIKQRELNFAEMRKFYGMLSQSQIEIFFWLIISCNSIPKNLIPLGELVFCLVYYSIGFASLFMKSVKFLDLFNVLCIVGLLSQMIQAYI